MYLLLLALIGASADVSSAQSSTWLPSRAIELIVGVTPGGGVDRTARTIQRIVHERRLIDAPMVVSNKPGGGGTISLAYLNQRVGDAHYLEISATSLLTNQIISRTSVGHRDFTPIVMLYDEYLGFAVTADSPIKDGRQLLEALRSADPPPIGIATSAGNTNHIGAALVARSAGVDARRLKVVVFGSGGESMTALLGGHVGLVVTPSANLIPHLQAGRMRVLGVSAPRRIEGALASVPTWGEQGVDAIVANWRPVIGAKGWSAAQIAYWEDVFGKLVNTDDWRNDIARLGGIPRHLGSRDLAAFFDAEHARFRVILTELGLAKPGG